MTCLGRFRAPRGCAMLLLLCACSGSDHAELFGHSVPEPGAAHEEAGAASSDIADGAAGFSAREASGGDMVPPQPAGGGGHGGTAEPLGGGAGVAGSQHDGAGGAATAPPVSDSGAFGMGAASSGAPDAAEGGGGGDHALPDAAPDAIALISDAAAGDSCVKDAECGAQAFCKKTSCAPTASGRCTVRPTACASTEGPVCGCDGVSYFNACLAARQRQSIAASGACTATALHCSRTNDAVCTALSAVCGLSMVGERNCPGPSFPGAQGQCWVFPPECGPNGGPPDRCMRPGTTCVRPCDTRLPPLPFLREPPCN